MKIYLYQKEQKAFQNENKVGITASNLFEKRSFGMGTKF